jgi:hypothetical protein
LKHTTYVMSSVNTYASLCMYSDTQSVIDY